MNQPFECRACSCTETKPGPTRAFVTCANCGGFFGRGTKDEIHQVVVFHWAEEEVPFDALRFFDVEFTGPDSANNCHGWFDPSTKRVHQFG